MLVGSQVALAALQHPAIISILFQNGKIVTFLSIFLPYRASFMYQFEDRHKEIYLIDEQYGKNVDKSILISDLYRYPQEFASHRISPKLATATKRFNSCYKSTRH